MAADAYSLALVLVPDDAPIHVQCGHMNKELGRYEKAEGHYRQAKMRMRQNGDLSLQFGHLYKLMGRLDESVAAYEEAAALLHQRPDVVVELEEARLLWSLAPRERLRRKILTVMQNTVDWDRYLQANPDLKNIRMDLAEHFLLHGWREGRDLDRHSGKDLTNAVWRDGFPVG